MDTSTLGQLQTHQWYMHTPPTGGESWRLLRTDNDHIVLESPALVHAPSNEQMQMALWLGLSQGWQTPARLLLLDGVLRLQACWVLQALPNDSTLWSMLHADMDNAQTGLNQAALTEVAQEDDLPMREFSAQEQALMQQLMALIETDPSLKPLLDLDVPSASLSIEPRGGAADWLILMQPSTQEGHVWAFLPQALLADDESSRHNKLAALLQHNDVLQLGPHIQIVTDAQALQPMLQTRFDVTTTQLPDLRIILARLLAADEDINPSIAPADDDATPADTELSHLLINGLRG
jgi:hypothetical protein